MGGGVLSGPWTWRRFRSFVYLAIAFNRRQFRRIFQGKKDDGGERRFLENFAGEGMAPLTAGEASLILDLSRCTFCGICEAVCPVSSSGAPMDRWPAFARVLDAAVHAAADLPATCPAECRICEAACPTGVPLRAIPAFVRRGRPGQP